MIASSRNHHAHHHFRFWRVDSLRIVTCLEIGGIPDQRTSHAISAAASAADFRADDGNDLNAVFAQSRVLCRVAVVGAGGGKVETGFQLASRTKFLEPVTFMILNWFNPKSS
jgi:hypothetical protein